MASEETEVAAQNAAPTKPRATGSSASRWGILAGLRERLKRIRLIDLLPGLVLGVAVMALYTYYSLSQENNGARGGRNQGVLHNEQGRRRRKHPVNRPQ